jgi:hypothetical protein
VLVKESFKPVVAEKAAARSDDPVVASEDQAVSERYVPGERAGLFITAKLDPALAGTDQGWVYATTTPDASRILQAGVIQSCVECHQETARDRLYGPRWSWPLVDGRPRPPTAAYAPEEKEESLPAGK